MLRNYIKIALRNLVKNKVFSAINISGLAIGMAAVMLILIWVKNEVTYDNFHADSDRIYQLWNKGEWSDKMQNWPNTPKVATKFLKQDFPEIEKAARFDWAYYSLLKWESKKLTASGNVVDPEFLDIFTFPLLKGNRATLFKDPHSIVLSERLAKSLFGDQDPIGKILRRDNEDNFRVTGVLKDLPTNTKFDFDYLIPWEWLVSTQGEDNGWGNNSVMTYIKLKDHVSADDVQPRIAGLRKKHQENYDGTEMFLYPLERWRLYGQFENGVETGGWIEVVRLMSIISVFILVVACINFVNLSTARSERRAKEVGIRKTVGAVRTSLIRQFLGESLLLVFFAFILSLLLIQLALPAFGQLVGKPLTVEYGSIYFWLVCLVFVLLTGFLAGCYPAFFLSSFRPVEVLKGTFKARGTFVTPRKVLVVTQFGFAVSLIVCTVIVRQQIRHVLDRDTGYKRDNLAYSFMMSGLEQHYSALKNDLFAGGLVQSVCKTSAPITEGWSDSWGFEWKGKDPADKTVFDRYCADADFVKTMGVTLTHGRDLNLKDFPTDSTAVLINESALKAMNFKDPVGQIVTDGGIDWHIVGVFKDFILNSPYHPTRPMIVEGAGKRTKSRPDGWFNVIHMRLKPEISGSEIKQINDLFAKYTPEFTYSLAFVDKEYAAKLADEKRIGTFAAVFAGLTIFISCLGLFGLAAFMAESRIKEIGIRKVLGASVSNITALLAMNFLKLVCISILIATPAAWWFMDDWLSDYPYHVNIKWWVFVAAGAGALVVALITVSFQAIKAAIANPVKNLRTE